MTFLRSFVIRLKQIFYKVGAGEPYPQAFTLN